MHASLGGEQYRPTAWEHALFHAVPQARTVTTVELAPLDWAFGDDAPLGLRTAMRAYLAPCPGVTQCR